MSDPFEQSQCPEAIECYEFCNELCHEAHSRTQKLKIVCIVYSTFMVLFALMANSERHIGVQELAIVFVNIQTAAAIWMIYIWSDSGWGLWQMPGVLAYARQNLIAKQLPTEFCLRPED